jgi:deazaflavin-dependent oxidoreductase (nitroreductase family)
MPDTTKARSASRRHVRQPVGLAPASTKRTWTEPGSAGVLTRAITVLGRRVIQLVQRIGSTRAGVYLIGQVVSPLQRQLYQRSGGRLSLTGRAPMLLLTTIGRRTGKPRTVPVFYLRDGDRLVICNVNPGFEHPNPWTLNLRADPAARVQVGPSVLEMRGRPASDQEFERYWPDLVKLWPAYRSFYERGGTRSVFILEPPSLRSIEPNEQ